MSELVFLPLSGGQLHSWAETGRLPGSHTGYAVTSAMTGAFGLTDPEDAEYNALSIASVAGLLAHGERVVAVLDTGYRAGDDNFGAVELADPGYDRVTALFGEDTDAAQAAAAALTVRGMTLDQAWEAPVVQALLTDRDLLWYGPAEWRLLGVH
ncbi:MAG: hypothetical protein QM804_00455 [Propionicimonas sp.]